MTVVEAVIRDDAASNGGGDVTQTRAYLDLLDSHGFEVCETTVSAFARTGGTADVALVFNTARPMEWTQSIRRARRGLGIVGVPIHHPEPWFDEFERRGRHGWNRLLGLVRPHTRRAAVKAAVRRPSARTLAATLRPSLLTEEMQECVDLVDSWIFIADGERRHLEEELGRALSAPTFTVRNGVAPLPSSNALHAEGFDVLIVGRIEERKNVLHAVEALGAAGLTVGVIGGPDGSCPAYVRRFESAAAALPTVQHLGHVPHPDVLALMANSRVYVSTSWFEVVSLAELEAASMGMSIVGTERAFSGEYLPDRRAVHPEDAAALVDAVRACMNDLDRPRARPHFAWRADESALLEAVRVAAEAGKRRLAAQGSGPPGGRHWDR